MLKFYFLIFKKRIPYIQFLSIFSNFQSISYFLNLHLEIYFNFPWLFIQNNCLIFKKTRSYNNDWMFLQCSYEYKYFLQDDIELRISEDFYPQSQLQIWSHFL